MSRNIVLGLVQMKMSDDIAANVDHALGKVDEAANKGAQIVCLPELFSTPYFCTVEKCPKDYAVEAPGDIGKRLAESAKRNKIVLVGGSIYERAESGRFNTALVYGPDGSHLGSYRKMHIPHDPAFYEQNYFAPGDMGYRIFDTPLCRFGVLICYDQWFPEAARSMALQGAEIIFYPTAIGTLEGVEQTEGSWQEAWETVQRGHAIANNVVVAAVNRVGKEGDSVFWGGTFIADAFGKLIAKGGAGEEVVVGKVDLDHNELVREGWGFFRNRRPDTYEKLGNKGAGA